VYSSHDILLLLLPLPPQPSLGLGLLHKIRLNFLEASQQFSFLQGRVVNPTPNPHPGGPGLYIYIPQRQDIYIYIHTHTHTHTHAHYLEASLYKDINSYGNRLLL
jgi:hypothetical protein